jgi:hypothetical protein
MRIRTESYDYLLNSTIILHTLNENKFWNESQLGILETNSAINLMEKQKKVDKYTTIV